MGFNDVNQNVFGLVALIVSLVALLTTVIQVLQQYFSSAEGYRRCANSVMGQWAKGTHRKLVPREFRFEVIFETPVIFVAPPDNQKGPIPGRKIYYVDGSDNSYTNTKVLKPLQQNQADQQAVRQVHTADDERASWLTLLSTQQGAELDSRIWDRKQRGTAFKEPYYQIAVGLQSKTRSWDFIPDAITKPYATSAICHLVEMMAMLGLYWKVFDQILWNLRAEGNGFILTSTTVHGLGVMVVFAITGRSNFEGNRVIPAEAVKELAFGTVPNIFEEGEYLKREKDAQSLELVFGEEKNVTATLESLGCTSETVTRFAKDHKHIFSVSFEIIGMLGKVFRIRGSNFRMLPNPTMDFWLKTSGQKASWKTSTLMKVFQEKLKKLIITEGFDENHQCTVISRQWDEIAIIGCEDEATLSIEAREAIHNALDNRTTYLLSLKQIDVLSVLVAHLTKVMKILDDQNSPLNNIVLANKEDTLLSYYFDEIRPAVIGNLESNSSSLTREEKAQRNTVWISLIFRMLCWLLLHDFDKSDIKMVPSDLKGSRMPVYIG
ncbi:hypothetical protein LHYA1_G008601 [Lachnellula hyalina]|uniref:Modin n=1 Tax=Lachnellula hyalina TaxID=1316788 RepID=A0A8H8TUX6_9HELO|nr:uncharacterized protein LHYA1_G008601 [Lachnellula hyalina]TVY22737.1 hypothetical protein LHYA1_G008601 [Lachnellula hyalina]